MTRWKPEWGPEAEGQVVVGGRRGRNRKGGSLTPYSTKVFCLPQALGLQITKAKQGYDTSWKLQWLVLVLSICLIIIVCSFIILELGDEFLFSVIVNFTFCFLCLWIYVSKKLGKTESFMMLWTRNLNQTNFQQASTLSSWDAPADWFLGFVCLFVQG